MTTTETIPRKTLVTLRPDERRRLDEAARRAHFRTAVDFIRQAALRTADEMGVDRDLS